MEELDELLKSGIGRVKIEIICSEALEEDFTEHFENAKVGKFYTKITKVQGAGYNNPHLGDAIWPQLNTMYIIYCTEEEAVKIVEIVRNLRKVYVTEGIACFLSSGTEV